MKRVAATIGLVAALAVSASFASASPTQSGKRTAVTPLTIWVGWSAGTELISFKKVVAEYQKANPNVSIKVVGGINDDKIIAALRAGNAPDVVSSFQSNNVGVYCPSGGWIDLGPYLKRDQIDVNQFPAATRYYTEYKGIRCALPLLADTYGFYYNKTLFKQAGIASPAEDVLGARRRREEADEEERRRHAQGGRLRPERALLPRRRGHRDVRAADRRDVLRQGGQVEPLPRSGLDAAADLAEEPHRLLRVQEAREVADRRRRRVLRVARVRDRQARDDARRRVARLVHQARAPDARTTARHRCPSTTRIPSSTAAATSTARSSACRRPARTATQAWELVKYLTTNDHALAKFSNEIRNVPSTASSSKSPELKPDARLQDVPRRSSTTSTRRRCRSRRSGSTTSRRSRTSSRSGMPGT